MNSSSDINKGREKTVPFPFSALTNIAPSTWVEISARAINYNIAAFKKIIGTDNSLGIVIKSNAYGHGMVPIAQLCEKNSAVDWLMVSHVSEAVELREAGITKRILLISPTRENLLAAAFYDCDIMVTDYDVLEQLQRIGHELQKKIPIHIKVDTGLSRFGFTPHEIIPLIQFVKNLPMISITGIYTHFAESNNSDLAFTHKQSNIFNELLVDLEQAGITVPFRHHSNTAGISSVANDRVNVFRLGAGTYGIWPSEQNRALVDAASPLHLLPALSWKTKIVHIKTIAAGSFVGYNRTYLANKETRVAVLPVGYYDGYDKRLSNKGVVRVKDQNAPIIGTIAMNATMIDISHIPHVQCDETVTLLGDCPQISAADLAGQTGCFNARQITTQINVSIPRIVV